MEKNKSFKNLEKCRLCDSIDFQDFLNLGKIPLGNNLQKSKKNALLCAAYPLKIKRCKNCMHFQLSVAIQPELLFARNYTYLSSIGKSFVSHLKKYANWACDYFSLGKNSLVIDIGSNDGTCLKFFKEKGCNVLGIDPATTPAEIANKNGIKTYNAFFNKSIAKNIIDKYGYADLITSHNVLAHVDNLQDVFKNIYFLLKEEGFFIFEVGYFKSVLESGCFDTTYHEHLDYHHGLPLTRYLHSLGFSIIGIETNNIQGGSLRFLTQKNTNPKIHQKAKQFLKQESVSVLYDVNFLSNWEEKIMQSMQNLKLYIQKNLNSDYLIAGYGAPTKASLLLTLANLGINEISFIIEDNELKVGRYLPKTGIPIVCIKELRKKKPNLILILAWNFAEDIITKLRATVDWPIKCVVPLPELKIIDL